MTLAPVLHSNLPAMADMDPGIISLQGGQVDAARPSQPEDKDASNDTHTASTVRKPEIHYPSGIILVLIVGGLLLSMFLVALDMVSSIISLLGTLVWRQELHG